MPRMGTSASRASRTRAISRMASSESPPSSKKLSSAPTRSRPSTSANRAQTISSVSVRGPRLVTGPPGAGSAARSSFPFTVTGSASSSITVAGTRYSGNRAATCSRSPSAVTASASPPGLAGTGTTYPTRRFWPGWSSRATTAAWLTAGWLASTASISPGSMRTPCSLTWSSARPANSSSPSAVQRARSPVRYIRAPAAPNGQATNRSAVRAARPRYPRARPAPATYSSPATPGGTGSSSESST